MCNEYAKQNYDTTINTVSTADKRQLTQYQCA